MSNIGFWKQIEAHYFGDSFAMPRSGLLHEFSRSSLPTPILHLDTKLSQILNGCELKDVLQGLQGLERHCLVDADIVKQIITHLWKRGDMDMLSGVLSALPDVNALNHSGCSILHEAANGIFTSNSFAVILHCPSLKIHLRDRAGNTPLMNYIQNIPLPGEEDSYLTILALFLSRITEKEEQEIVNAKDHPLAWGIKKESTFIHKAVLLENELALEMLLQCGLSQNRYAKWNTFLAADCIDSNGETPLWQAVCTGKDELAAILITYGADPSKKSPSGQTPLQEAEKQQKGNLVEKMKQSMDGGRSEQYINATKEKLISYERYKVGTKKLEIDTEAGVLEFFKKLSKTANCSTASPSSSFHLKQKLQLSRVREAVGNLFSSVVQDYQKGVTLPSWPRIFHSHLVICNNFHFFDSERIESFYTLLQEYLKSSLRSTKDLTASMCAQSFIIYLESHSLDITNSLIGLCASHKKLSLRLELLSKLYGKGEELKIYPISQCPATHNEETIRVMTSWRNDVLLTADELRDRISALLAFYQLEKEAKDIWMNEGSPVPSVGDLLIYCDDSHPAFSDVTLSLSPPSTKRKLSFRYVRCASVPEPQGEGEERNHRQIGIFDTPSEQLIKYVDIRLLLPLPIWITTKLKNIDAPAALEHFQKSLVVNPLSNFELQLKCLAKELMILIIGDFGGDATLFTKSPEILVDENSISGSDVLLARLVALIGLIKNIHNEFKTYDRYKQALDRFVEYHEEFCSNGRREMFVPSQREMLIAIENIYFEDYFTTYIELIKTKVENAYMFIENLQRLEFERHCIPHPSTNEYTCVLKPFFESGWIIMIKRATRSFLQGLHYHMGPMDTLSPEQLKKNYQILCTILNPQDALSLNNLHEKISDVLFPMLDYYTRKAYDSINDVSSDSENIQWVSVARSPSMENCRKVWQTVIAADIQAILTLKIPSYDIHESSYGGQVSLFELIHDCFAKKKEKVLEFTQLCGMPAILPVIKSPSIMPPSSSHIRKFGAKMQTKELRKLFKTDPLLSSVSIFDLIAFMKNTACVRDIIKWCKSDNQQTKETALRFLCLLAFSDQTELKIVAKDLLHSEGLLPELYDLIRSKSIKFHKRIEREEFQLGVFIAQGSGGMVFECTYMDNICVIKKCTSEGILYTSSEEVAVEVALNCVFSHPNVMTCTGARIGQAPYIIMRRAPFCLEEILLSKRDIPWPVRYKIAYEVALGMEHIHSWKVVHRDIKSANILLDYNYDCCITDFGISRTIHKRMSANMGTIFWMAPEVFRDENENHYGYPSDVYSYGILLWEIMERTCPYTETPSWSVPAKVAAGYRPQFSDHTKAPTEYKNLMISCWDANPKARPTFAQIIKKLEPLVDYKLLSTLPLLKDEPSKKTMFKKSPARLTVNRNHSDSLSPLSASIGHQRTRNSTLSQSFDSNPSNSLPNAQNMDSVWIPSSRNQ